jgi:NADH dehydrogenase
MLKVERECYAGNGISKEQTAMKVAVIGGTGFVGNYIVEALQSAGHDVSVLIRAGSEAKLRQGNVWRRVTGDIDDKLAVDKNVAGCEAVIYCVGILREVPRKGITFAALQFEGAARAIDACRRNGVKRFLLMSANGVKAPGTRYQETKKRAEDCLLDSGLDGTIFRPSVIFGDPGNQMEIATQLYRDIVMLPFPAAGFVKSGDVNERQIMLSPVHVEDVATAFANALEDRATIGGIYQLGGPEAISWNEMIRRVAAAAGRRKWILPMPIRIMKLGATLFDWLPFFPVTRDQLIMLEEGNTADPEVIRALIHRPPKPFSTENLAYLVA